MVTPQTFLRTIIVTDLHGCYQEFLGLLKKTKFSLDNGDRLVVLGDMVDRGPSSSLVVDHIMALQLQGVSGQVLAIQGNHDNKYVRYHAHAMKAVDEPSYKNPMRLSMDKEQVYRSLSEDSLEWLSSLPTTIHFPEFNLLCVHGGFSPFGFSPNRTTQDTVSRIQEQKPAIHLVARFYMADNRKLVPLDNDHNPPTGSKHWTEIYDGSVNVVYGHHVHSMEEPYVVDRASGIYTIGLDTGCCFGGKLSALVMDGSENAVVQVPANKTYRNL